MSAAPNQQERQAQVQLAPRQAESGVERMKVYQHSDLLYWWVVWTYGFLCAFLTYVWGVPITIPGAHKPVLIYPEAWLGISFVGLMLFVLVFTNARARGVKSLVLFLVLTVIVLSVQMAFGWNRILQYFPLLLVHMNLAFYLLFSTVLLAAWAFVIMGTDHSTYWEFGANSIAKKYWFTDAGESYTSPQVETARHSDDIFVHRLLGLWFLGFGTGDIEIRFSTAGSGQKVYLLKNVWRAGHVEKEINRLVA
jgi:hypothetical protein